jgi:predicted nucleotidyltransferase component of viral defense system
VLEKTQKVLELISNDDIFKNNDIRFVGGTALSHIIKHRLSEDLDFAAIKLNPKKIIKMMDNYGAIKMEHDPTMKDYVENDGEDIDNNYMKFMLNGVKVEFFTPPFNTFEVNVWTKDKYNFYKGSNLKIASLDTIIYMKTMAFWNRKKYRDLFDIYFVIEEGHTTTDKFINRYLENNIQYNIDDLYRKIQSVREFYEKLDDEGINTLVQNPKTYEWYRLKIENFIHEEVLAKVYQDN